MKDKSKIIVFIIISVIYLVTIVAAHEGDHAAVCADCGGHAAFGFLRGTHVVEVYCDDVNLSRLSEYNERFKQLDGLSGFFIVGGMLLIAAVAVLHK